MTEDTALLFQIVHGHVGGGGGGADTTVRGTMLLWMPLKVAVMLEAPADNPVANPTPLIVAAARFDELHATCAEIFCELLF
jgi:hypothetical protein